MLYIVLSDAHDNKEEFMVFWFGMFGFLLVIGALSETIHWGWSILGLTFIYSSMTLFRQRYKAASNAIRAKYTFDLLSESDRDEVMESVSNLMSTVKYPARDSEDTLNFMRPEQRYGFIALGMSRIGILPKIGNEWYEVHNPFSEILGAHREIAWVKHQIKRKYGVDVNFDNV